jgi:hypothetical protein
VRLFQSCRVPTPPSTGSLVSGECDQPPLICFGVCGRKAITKPTNQLTHTLSAGASISTVLQHLRRPDAPCIIEDGSSINPCERDASAAVLSSSLACALVHIDPSHLYVPIPASVNVCWFVIGALHEARDSREVANS